MAIVGLFLGVLIGVVTALVALLLIRTAWRAPANDLKKILTIVTELLGIPAFWFGGPWVTTSFISAVEIRGILPWYMASLACVFTGILMVPLLRMIAGFGRQIAAAESGVDTSTVDVKEETHE